MTPPKSRRFYDALRENVRSAYESQRNAAFPAEAEPTPAGEARSESRSVSTSEWTSVSRSESTSVNQSEHQSEGRKVNQRVNQSEGQCGDHCEEHSQGLSEGQSQDQSEHQSRDQSVSRLYSLHDDKAALCRSLGENPRRLLAAMIAIEKRWLCLNLIPLRAANGTPMTYPSKRTALKRLTELGFVVARRKKDFGTNKGLAYTLDETLCEAFRAAFPGFVEEAGRPFAGEHCEGQCEHQSEGQCQGHSESQSEERSGHQSESTSVSRSECSPDSSSIEVIS